MKSFICYLILTTTVIGWSVPAHSLVAQHPRDNALQGASPGKGVGGRPARITGQNGAGLPARTGSEFDADKHLVTTITTESTAALDVATSRRNMVATVHPLATRAGVEAMEEGGNAVDAAVAAALTLGVVDGFNSGIGGGCFIVIRTSSGEVVAIDGREMAPAAAHRKMFYRDGEPDTTLSQIGPLASGVPGALAALHDAVAEHGEASFDELILPAAQIAENGFKVTESYENNLATAREHLVKYSGSAAVLLKPDGTVYQAGETLIQTDLARTYRKIAEQGIDYFYHGEFAERVGEWMQSHGGLITREDFANYRVVRRRPVITRYRGRTIYGFPPPSSGGTHVGQILNILEPFDLQALRSKEPGQFVHVVTEAMKLAFADRAHWLGDPDHVDVPRGLIDPDYGRRLAEKIDPQSVTPVKSHGVPPRADSDLFGKHTTHIAAADAHGNWVAITTTVNTTFGSKVIVPGTGVVLNNQMDDFSIAPGTPNAYGLIGSEANSVAPGKRPLSSMSPTIIERDGRPVMTLGAAGGPRIITQVVLAIIRHVDLEMGIEEAIRQPRFHHQWSPDRLYVEKGMPETTVRFLRNLGHRVEFTSRSGISQAIVFDAATGLFKGVADPRTQGAAAGAE